ncbi:Type-1 restriction enzyme EcoKI specificity protein [Pseudovibrio sp. W64]|uniref:restriction endonuclease subunit S n=1 Tax=Pseudovibrio sp. W64 TaxID=1735583 RepID=UPI0007AEC472|nr:restriction endonuclease subunit S [Pseudovibrio sp. W64]KZK79373.1 Type-1 restriction enzyme EcoKI specificity protein [Pseudovibrio sp. W64]
MSELPAGWVDAELELISGSKSLVTDGDWVESKDQDPNGDVRLIQLADIGDGFFKDKSSRFMTSDNAEMLNCTFLQKGDVLIARMPDPLGRACIFPDVGQSAVTVVDVQIWRASADGALPEWVVNTINSPNLRKEIESQSSGTTRKRISGAKLKKLLVPLPPLAEQKRIVAKIESLTEKSRIARENLARIDTLTKRYKQAILKKAFSGELTADWRRADIASVAEKTFDGPFGSSLKTADYTDAGHRVVRLENIGHLFFKMEKETYVSNAKFQTLAKHILKCGDILFSSFVDEEVRVCQVPKELDNNAINKADCFCIRLDEAQTDSRFVMYQLGSSTTYEILKDLVHGATRPRINLKQLKCFELKLPSLLKQKEIVTCIEAAFAKIDRLAIEAKRALHLVDRLDEKILAKAFRGELVPQDPEDEPASVLLERIKAERAAQPKVVRKKVSRKKTEISKMAKTVLDALKEADGWLESQRLFQLCGVKDGTSTGEIELIYQQLLDLERQNKIEIKAVRNKDDIKQTDMVRFVA